MNVTLVKDTHIAVTEVSKVIEVTKVMGVTKFMEATDVTLRMENSMVTKATKVTRPSRGH